MEDMRHWEFSQVPLRPNFFQCIVDCVNEKDIIQNIPQEEGAHFQNITEYKASAIVSEKEVACDIRIVNIIQYSKLSYIH